MTLHPLPDLNSTDWYDWAAQTDAFAREPRRNPLHEVGKEKLRMARGEVVPVAGGAEQTMLSVNGPGCVESLWMAIGGGTGHVDGRIRIYYDGSSTPALDVDIGTLTAAHFGATGPWHTTPHMHMEIVGGGIAFLMKFPMPFGTSIRVTFYNLPTSASSTIYWMLPYRLYGDTDRADGWRLRGQGTRMQPTPVTLTATQTSTRMSTTGGPGAVIWHSYVGGYQASNLSWMERNFVIRTDDETLANAVVRATGTEDWFDSGWYFQGWSDFDAGLYSYVGADKPAANPTIVGMATDLLGKWGGVPFESSCDLFLDTEAVCTTSHSFSDCILYYSVA